MLVVLADDDRNAWLSFRNVPTVHLLAPGQLNAYDVLVAEVVVFTRETLPAEGAAAAQDGEES